MLEKNGIKYYNMRDIAHILSHDRDWVKVRIEAFNLQGIKERIKGVDSTLYDDSVIEYLRTHTYTKKKKSKGCKCKRNEDALSITEIAKRVGHDPDWVRFRLKYLNIQPSGTYFGHPAYSFSIIEEIKKITREDSFKEQHKPLTEEARKKQAETYKKYFWANKEKVLSKRYGTINELRKEFAKTHITLLEVLNENDWCRISVEKVCQYNQIPIINYKTIAWINSSDYPKLKDLMKEFKNLPHDRSYKEKEVVAFIQSIYQGIIKENTRRIITPKELDIYIPEKKIAIEFDGVFWHSSYVRDKEEVKTFHLEKTVACNEKGIRLIHIFEDEWNNKEEICKSIIASALGIYQQRIYARKCEVSSVDNETAKHFLNENHIQGNINGKSLGLFYQNELVQIITYGNSRFKKNELELYRMCTKLNTQVIGGFSKLLKHLESDSIISYIDRRLYNGRGYLNTGWQVIGYSKPSYFYTKGTFRENRMKYQKHMLKDKLEIYDENLNEEDNMEANGYYRIYDCGTIKVQFKNN